MPLALDFVKNLRKSCEDGAEYDHQNLCNNQVKLQFN